MYANKLHENKQQTSKTYKQIKTKPTLPHYPVSSSSSVIFYSSFSTGRGVLRTEIKVPSIENPELTKVLLSKPGVSQSIALHASPTAGFSSLS